MNITHTAGIIIVFFVFVSSLPRLAHAGADDEKTTPISLKGMQLTMAVPVAWEQKQPRFKNIVDHEFALEKENGDPQDGRFTISRVGGSVKQNVDRWLNQFSSPKPKKFKGDQIVKKMEIAGQTVHFVDVSGTFLERRIPVSPASPRANYRMFGAIIETENQGRCFFKCYGPEKTMAANEKSFLKMLKSLQVSE